MAASPSVLSQTLQAITTTKIEELEKQRQTYEATKNKILDSARDAGNDIRDRVNRLHAGARELGLLPQAELGNMIRWLDQSRYDPTVPESRLISFEEELRSRLDRQTRKLDLADLYSRLLIEWINSPGATEPDQDLQEDSIVREEFDVVEDIQKEKLQQLREKFEKVVFEPKVTDENEITDYLGSLFSGDHGKDALKELRDTINRQGEHLLASKRPVDRQDLKKCIQSLLKNDLLNDQKIASLGEFLNDDTVLDEIANVLNMRFANLENWSWNLGGKGMPVLPRQSLNGKWRVMMDEDVLQALLIHYIGSKWCVAVKEALRQVIEHDGVWRNEYPIPEDDQALRNYYLNEGSDRSFLDLTVESERYQVYKKYFFLAPMPSEEFEDAVGYDDDDDDDTDQDFRITDKLSPKEIKQLLLRTLATELRLGRAFNGEVAIVQSDFQWFATGVSHSTVFAILRFVGLQESWINFFKKVLEPPLDMMMGGPVRTRKRGLPMANILEKVFGELVLFFMDIAVHQQANLLLYRFHDDLWICGKPDRCAKAWSIMEQFASIMGLEFNESKTGSAYLTKEGYARNQTVLKALPEGPVVVNFLKLDPNTGDWIINEKHVQQHVEQLSKQLSDAKSVLEWVKTWNSCIGRFFSYTFGEPSNCFGRQHLDAILSTHQNIQRKLFDGTKGNGSTVAEHVKQSITARFAVSDIPDAFLYMPEALGGLGLHNPFIPLLLVREGLCHDPEELIAEFLRGEKTGYDKAKLRFENLTETERRRRFRDVFPKDEETGIRLHAPSSTESREFISYEKYSQWREYKNFGLLRVYRKLNSAAPVKKIAFTHAVNRELNDLADPPISLKELHTTVIDPEIGWLIQFYSNELKAKCGGLSIVDRSFLPLGVLKAMRKKKVAWQMAL